MLHIPGYINSLESIKNDTRIMMKSFVPWVYFYFFLSKKVHCSLLDEAINIANNVYDPTLITAVLWEYNDSVEISEFLVRYEGCITTVRVRNNNDNNITKQLFNIIRIKQTIFFVSNAETFNFMAKIIKKDIVNSFRSIVVLINSVDQSEVTKVMKAAWENDFGDIVVITKDIKESRNDLIHTTPAYDDEQSKLNVITTDDVVNDNKSIKLWTYYPYDSGNCENYNAVSLNVSNSAIFPKKFTNFHGCPVRLTLLHFIPYLLLKIENDAVKSFSGIDGETLLLLLNKLNASIEIVQFTDHGGMGTYINGKATGSFADLVNGIADIMAPALLLTDLRFPKSQMSYVYQSLDVHWCGPNQREIHAWAKVLLPFFTNITPFIILTFVIFIFVTKIIRHFDLHRPAKKRGIFFMSFVMFLGQEVDFETSSWLVNSLFILWIWFCMVVRIGYQGDLVDGLQKEILEPPLGLLEDALKKVDGYGGVEVFSFYYRNTSIAEKYSSLKLAEIQTYIEEVANGKRFLIATDILLLKWFRQTLQVLEKPLTRAAVCLYMRPGWPAAEETIKLTYTVAETGLVQKILNNFTNDGLLYSDQAGDVRDAQALNMATLGACFYGLLVMHLMCFLIFCLEIIAHRYGLKNKIQRKLKFK